MGAPSSAADPRARVVTALATERLAVSSGRVHSSSVEGSEKNRGEKNNSLLTVRRMRGVKLVRGRFVSSSLRMSVTARPSGDYKVVISCEYARTKMVIRSYRDYHYFQSKVTRSIEGVERFQYFMGMPLFSKYFFTSPSTPLPFPHQYVKYQVITLANVISPSCCRREGVHM